MTFKVTILGNGSAKPTIDKHHSAHALNVHEQFYLIDCGEGTQRRLIANGINLLKINAVFISHLHGDHVYGLFPMLSSMCLMGRTTALTIYAPKPLGEILETHNRYFDLKIGFPLNVVEVDTCKHQMVYENNVMEVWTVPLRHRVSCCGYCFKEKTPRLNVRKEAIERYGLGVEQIVHVKNGEDAVLADGRTIPNSELTYLPYTPRSYAYCSDTQMSGKVAKLVDGVDLLYHEATFSDADKALAKQMGHSTTVQAAKTAVKCGAKRLLIGHFSARYKNLEQLLDEARTIFPQTYLATEGTTFEISVQRLADMPAEEATSSEENRDVL